MSVTVDSSVGRDTKFTFSYAQNWTLDVAVMSPSGVLYSASGQHGVNSVASETVTISVQNQTEVRQILFVLYVIDT